MRASGGATRWVCSRPGLVGAVAGVRVGDASGLLRAEVEVTLGRAERIGATKGWIRVLRSRREWVVVRAARGLIAIIAIIAIITITAIVAGITTTVIAAMIRRRVRIVA